MAARKRGEHLTPADRATLQARFLAVYAETGIILQGCRAANVDRGTVKAWRLHDPAFAEKFDAATEDADDIIRTEIHRRGVLGWDEVETVVSPDGERVKTVHKYDASLLRLVAQARMPEYKERLDVTSGDERLPDYEAVLHDAVAREHLAQLVERVAGYGEHTGGPGVAREQ